MDKTEFLDILGQTLKGEVGSDVIEQNIRYYDQYISSQSYEEETKIIELLGDPRMIAKTVIEKDKAAKQKSSHQDNNGYESSTGNYSDGEEDSYQQRRKSQGSNLFYTNLTWSQKLILILALIVVIVLFVIIGRIIIGFLFAFGVPILLVLLLYALFKKRN